MSGADPETSNNVEKLQDDFLTESDYVNEQLLSIIDGNKHTFRAGCLELLNFADEKIKNRISVLCNQIQPMNKKIVVFFCDSEKVFRHRDFFYGGNQIRHVIERYVVLLITNVVCGMQNNNHLTRPRNWAEVMAFNLATGHTYVVEFWNAYKKIVMDVVGNQNTAADIAQDDWTPHYTYFDKRCEYLTRGEIPMKWISMRDISESLSNDSQNMAECYVLYRDTVMSIPEGIIDILRAVVDYKPPSPIKNINKLLFRLFLCVQ